jgi:NADPH:quinone reductase-like Zn-dependent oxidoreductase
LAQVYHCNLLLMVRGAGSKQPESDAGLDRKDPHVDFAIWLQQLQSKANRVEVLRAELGDADDLARALAPVIGLVARGMRIDYVFHTAGRGEGALVQMRSESESIATLAPKVTTARFLCENLARLGSPVLLLFSSLGNLVPKEKVGQIAYVAANACLEAYAEQVRRQGGKALAIGWDDWAESGMALRSARQLDSVLKASLATATPNGAVWRRRLSLQHDWWLDEHRLDASTAVMPAMGMVALVFTALGAIKEASAATFSLHDMTIEQPLVVTDAAEVDVVVVFAQDLATFEIYSGSDAFSPQAWRKHAAGKIKPRAAQDPPVAGGPFGPVTRHLFKAAGAAGISPRWQNVVAVDQIGAGEIVNVLELPAAYRGEAEASGLHVALLDTATLTGSPDHESGQFAPASIGSFVQFAPMADRVRSCVEVQDLGSSKLLQVRIFAADGKPLVKITDLLLVDATRLLAGAAELAPAAAPDEPASLHSVMRLRDRADGGSEFAFAARLEPRRGPGPLEVEIQVKAAGLNFKDVLIALEVLPAPSDPTMTFGQEAAGVITRVGSQVKDLQVGDRVMCAGHSCLAEHVIMPRQVVAKIPSTLGFQQAAGIPVAFTTAWIALRHAAHLRKGERVLIHSAASGVGMAALQIARHLGAKVWATAGSEEKCRLLRSMGAEATANSRTREFADQFRRQLGHRPFDVVLNALAGELQQESISLLAPQGRFAELGLRDILANNPLALSIFAQGGSFHAVQAGADHPAYEQAWSEVIGLLEEETLRPLPTRVYPASQIASAFQLMAQGRHIGKIVIAMDAHEEKRSFVEKLQAEGLSNLEGARVAMAMAAIAVGTPLAYVAVSKLPIGLVLEQQEKTQQMLVAGSVLNPPAADAECVESTLKGASADVLLAAMQSVLGSFLGVTSLDPDVSFFELGATSLDLIQFARILAQRLEREIPVALLFKAASLRELSQELAPSRPAATQPEAPQLVPRGAQVAAEDRRRTLNARRRLRGARPEGESQLDE